MESNTYIKKFVDRHQLPLVSDIRARTHDLSFHVASLILPPEVFVSWNLYIKEFDMFFEALTIEAGLQIKKMPVEEQETLRKSSHF